jgi:hypothetical protein
MRTPTNQATDPGDPTPRPRGGPFDDAAVETMLAAQGYAVPADDLSEITTRLNDAIAHALSWDAHSPFDEEPWPQWPAPGADG